MAAPTYVGHSAANCLGTTSADFTVPSGAAEGDLLLIVCESSDSSTAGGTPNTPTDWTKIFENTIGSGAAGVSTLTIFARLAPTSPATTTVDGVGDHIVGRMAAVSGHDVSNVSTDIVIGTVTDHGTGLSNSTLGITVTADSLVLWVMGLSDDANDTTNASGQTNADLADITERWDNTSSTGAGGGISLTTGTCAGTTVQDGAWTHDTAIQSQSLYLGIPPAPPPDQNLTGSVFTKAPTFATALVAVDQALTGSVFTKAPTFPTGAVSQPAPDQNLTGSVYQLVPTFPASSVQALYTLTGAAFTRAPTFPAATLSTSYDLAGTTYALGPSFPTGDVSQPGTPQSLTGSVYAQTPTFPTGAVVAGAVDLTGSPYALAPAFPTGQIAAASPQDLTGTTFTTAPTFAFGQVIVGGMGAPVQEALAVVGSSDGRAVLGYPGWGWWEE